MGRLYEACQQVIQCIDDSGEDVYRTRGAIAIRTGFLVTLVDPDAPDDPEQLAKLAAAAKEVLGLQIRT